MEKMHYFSVSEASKYGVNKAILLSNLRYWLDKNKANNTNNFDGYYWTFNSTNALSELFPYMKQKSISRWLNELEYDGIIKSSKQYNKKKFDRTKWYTILNEYHSISQNEKSIPQNEETIPDINTDSKPDNKNTKKEDQFEIFWKDYPRKVSKGAARKSFNSALKKVSFDEIISGLLGHDIQKAKEEKFIPHASTWLNGERWSDQKTEKVKSSNPWANGMN